MSDRTSSLVHLLGLPKRPVTTAPATHSTATPLPPLPQTHSLAVVANRPRAKAQVAPSLHTGGEPAKASAPTKAKAPTRSFAHLIQPDGGDDDTLAADILAAGRKRRTPTGANTPKPTGLAAEIVAAGKKRRAIQGVKS